MLSNQRRGRVGLDIQEEHILQYLSNNEDLALASGWCGLNSAVTFTDNVEGDFSK